MTTIKHFGYWVFGSDMMKVNLENLKQKKVTDIFLNYYAFNTHGEEKVLSWIAKAKTNNIDVHIWMQCFYNGEWQNPVKTDTSKKIKEAKKYANMKGVKGVHLDYLRYPGTAYKTSGGAEAITKFVKTIRSQNPNTFLSCAVMPEEDSKYYYGQDIDALGKIVDAILPMQYKGNYEAGTNWLKSTTQSFSKKATIWSGLQTYKSDDDSTLLSAEELLNDANTCLNSGAKGVILFRYGISKDVDFTKIDKKEEKTMASYSYKTILSKAKIIKESAEKKYKAVGGVWSYYIAKAIVTPNKDIKKISFKGAPNPKYYDKLINVKMPKADYVKMAKQLIKFVEEKKRLPNYIVWNNKKIRTRDYTYNLAKILVWYSAHENKLPSYNNINTDVWVDPKNIKLHDYLTSYGCSGMGQCTGYYCGCNSLQQCFYRLTGIHVSESTIASVAGTTSDGTDHEGLNTAVYWFNNKYGKNVKITWKNFSDLGSSDTARWTELKKLIKNGAVFVHLLYRDQWGHYEVPKDVGDDYLSILNSLGDSCGSGTYCGYVETRSKSAQKSYMSGISQKSIAILTNG